MLVVADTAPINYLIQIRQIGVLIVFMAAFWFLLLCSKSCRTLLLPPKSRIGRRSCLVGSRL